MSAARWKEQVLEQLTYHWDMQVRPRLDGLTDEEYHWEPAPGCWSLHKREDGTWFPDWQWPEPDPRRSRRSPGACPMWPAGATRCARAATSVMGR
jgi:hypothetical protein